MTEKKEPEKNPGTALTQVAPPEAQAEIIQPYPLLRPGYVSGLLEVLRDNVGQAGIQALDLPRIKVPSGDSIMWKILTLEGEESAKTIEGIILAWRTGRLYWKKALAEGGRQPPDCTSRDGFVGIGDPGGPCAQCPYARFGSSTKGKGQACKQIRQLLLVRPDEVLPCLLSVPPTSLKSASQYFMALLARAIPYWGVITKISLEKATNENGIIYAKMTFAGGKLLSAQERITLAPFHNQMQDMLSPGIIDARDYQVEDDGQQNDNQVRDSEVPF
jgi:hypothetical protein